VKSGCNPRISPARNRNGRLYVDKRTLFRRLLLTAKWQALAKTVGSGTLRQRVLYIGPMSYELIEVRAKSDWQEYHSLRRRVLWERRGLTNYDETHADEYKAANHPLLLKLDGRAIGTVRLDDFGNGAGAVRLVAIEPDLQRQGHGRVLSDYVENYARRLGIKTLYVNAAPEAVGYYEKLAWKPEVWDEAELVGIASARRQMSKRLTLSQRVSVDTRGAPEELPLCMHNSISPFLDVLKTWAARQPDVLAVAIVGSHARGVARPDSDIDVIMVVDDPVRYLETSVWLECFGRLGAISNEEWGLLQSRRVHYVDGTEVEFGITVRSWASTDPVDPGTKEVVSDGMLILHDRETLLQSLLTKLQQRHASS
jgi:N-acetylglutamate synthase-like GNAT family acetyltransferase